jgi:hypothetical protein
MQTDLVALKREDRTSLRAAPNVAVVLHYFVRGPGAALRRRGSTAGGGRSPGLRGRRARQLSDLVAGGGVLRSQKLDVAADRCADELVEFFQGAD